MRHAVLKAIMGIAMAVGPLDAAFASEEIALADGNRLLGFRSTEVPAQLQVPACDRYAFADTTYAPVKNGLYTATDKTTFLIENNCLMPTTGQATLSDQRTISFFQENDFNTEGNLAYFCQQASCAKVADGHYTLANGQAFEVVDGKLENGGFFDGTHVGHENRD